MLCIVAFFFLFHLLRKACVDGVAFGRPNRFLMEMEKKNIKNVFPLLKMNSVVGRVTSVKHLASDVYLFLCIYINIRRRPTRLAIRICIQFSLE